MKFCVQKQIIVSNIRNNSHEQFLVLNIQSGFKFLKFSSISYHQFSSLLILFKSFIFLNPKVYIK
jgi:hypothetical protein